MLDLKSQLKLELYNKIETTRNSAPVYCELILENGLKVLARRISPSHQVEVYDMTGYVDINDYNQEKSKIITPDFVDLFNPCY